MLSGRILGTLMLTVGVALFATFSGFLAQAFLSNNAERPTGRADGSAQAALAEVERLLAEQQAATEALRTQSRARARLSYDRTTQRKPMWLVVVSTVSPWRAAGRYRRQ